MKIGILQTGHAPDELRPETGDYDAMFAALLDGHGFDFVAYDVEGGILPKSAEEADGWLITGSKHGAYEDHDWIPPLEDLIRAAHANKQPIVGICFGHQIIAQALGGKVEKFAGGWSVGHTTYDFDGDEIRLNAWHQDQVTERPSEARVVGSSDFCENAALAYGDHIWTVQPHPEFAHAFVDGLIQTRGKGVVPDHIMADARTRLQNPLDSDKVAQTMASVLKGAQK